MVLILNLLGDFEFYPKGGSEWFFDDMTGFARSEEHPSMATIREGKGQTSSREESLHGHQGRTSQFSPSINSQSGAAVAAAALACLSGPDGKSFIRMILALL